MKLVFIISLVALLLQVNPVAGQTVPMSGNIIDSINQSPLEGATVTIVDKNGQTLLVTKTAANGEFKADMPASTTKSIIITYTGFKTKTIPVTFKQLVKDYPLGNIYLYQNNSSLTEVVVRGVKPPVSFKIDRQVYKAGQFGNAANGSAVDVVRNLPSVSVNGQGEISFRGTGSFLLLLNGKPTQGDPAFVLSQLPANSIENVEVITSPSAVYDADGKSGIINIITKNGTDDGWMVQASTMYGFPPFTDFDNRRYTNPQRYSADFSVAYRKNKWDVSGGLNYLRNDMAGYREGDVFTIINNIKTSFPSAGERSFKRYNYGSRMSISYSANKNNTFSTGFYIGKKYQSRVADLQYTNSKKDLSANNITYFSYFNENTQEKDGVFTLANAEYIHQFADKSKIVFTALFERADLSAVTTNNNITSYGSTDTIQYTVNPSTNPLNAWRFKADYSRTIRKMNWQTGYQLRTDKQDGDFVYLTRVAGTNDFVTDPQFTSRVTVSNLIHAGYVQLASSADKLNYSAGVRVEKLHRQLKYSANSNKDRQDLTNLFPSLQLRYAAGNSINIKAGYSRRIKRTNNYELNPFPEREHSETLEQGDPNLLPELIGTYESGLEKSFTKGNFYITFYHQRVKNPIQRVNKVFNDTILNRVFTNAGKAVQTGAEMNFTWKPNAVWQSSIGGNIYKYNIKGILFNGSVTVNNSSWVFSINSTQSFTLPHDWSLQFSINYLSERVTAQGEDSYFLTPHFLVKKSSRNKRWTAQLQWLNIDAGMKISNRQRITTYGSNFYTTTNYIYEPDQLQFSVSFNLMRKNRKINLPVSEMGEKEF